MASSDADRDEHRFFDFRRNKKPMFSQPSGVPLFFAGCLLRELLDVS